MLPTEEKWESISEDYAAQGVSLVQHPMAWLKESLTSYPLTASPEMVKLKARKKVTVAGMVICRQRPPTASGVLFITLEDEFGFINLVIWRNTYERFREILITQSFLLCHGHIEKAQDGDVTHVIVEEAHPINVAMERPVLSHDFR